MGGAAPRRAALTSRRELLMLSATLQLSTDADRVYLVILKRLDTDQAPYLLVPWSLVLPGFFHRFLTNFFCFRDFAASTLT